jgi:hypothetical protein
MMGRPLSATADRRDAGERRFSHSETGKAADISNFLPFSI